MCITNLIAIRNKPVKHKIAARQTVGIDQLSAGLREFISIMMLSKRQQHLRATH
jgi:hypothetical protein